MVQEPKTAGGMCQWVHRFAEIILTYVATPIHLLKVTEEQGFRVFI